MMMCSENPLSLSNVVEEKYKGMVETDYWRLNNGQKQLCKLLRVIRYRLESKKFQQLIENTF